MKLFNPDYTRTFTCDSKKGRFVGYHINRPDTLPDNEKKRIFQMLYPIALTAFAQQASEKIALDVEHHIFSAHGLLIIADSDPYNHEHAIAFRMWDYIPYSVIDGDILYLAGMCVSSAYQRQGIGKALLDYTLWADNQHIICGTDQICPFPECRYVVMRTQNPVMKYCFDEATESISYPKGIDELIPPHIQEVGVHVARYTNDTMFNPHTLTSKGLYGRNLYGRKPRMSNRQYERLFSQIDQNAGDSLMCIWQRLI